MLSLILFLSCAYSALTTNLPSRQVSFQQRNLATITKIYERNKYPTNLQFIAGGPASVPAGLFNENATGRITPLGNFTGFNDSTEYFFALSPVPTPPSYTAFTDAKIVSFQSQCAEYASSVVYLYSSVVNPNASNNGQHVSTLKQIAFWEFDSEGAVLHYDAWIPNLALYSTYGTVSPGSNTTSAQVQAGTILSLCGTVQTLCKGSNTQYNSTQNCIDTLTAKQYGNWDEVWMDSVICRLLHIILARVDPKAHCPHVGPTGGGKCVNEPYERGYFTSDEALFGKPAGQNFICESTPSDRPGWALG